MGIWEQTKQKMMSNFGRPRPINACVMLIFCIGGIAFAICLPTVVLEMHIFIVIWKGYEYELFYE